MDSRTLTMPLPSYMILRVELQLAVSMAPSVVGHTLTNSGFIYRWAINYLMKGIYVLPAMGILIAALVYQFHSNQFDPATGEMQCLDVPDQENGVCAWCVTRGHQIKVGKAFIVTGTSEFKVLKVGKKGFLNCHEYLQLVDYNSQDIGQTIIFEDSEILRTLLKETESSVSKPLSMLWKTEEDAIEIVGPQFQQFVVFAPKLTKQQLKLSASFPSAEHQLKLMKFFFFSSIIAFMVFFIVWLAFPSAFFDLPPLQVWFIFIILVSMIIHSGFPNLKWVLDVACGSFVGLIQLTLGIDIGVVIWTVIGAILVRASPYLNILYLAIVWIISTITRLSFEPRNNKKGGFAVACLLVFLLNEVIWWAEFQLLEDSGFEIVELGMLSLLPFALILTQEPKIVRFQEQLAQKTSYEPVLGGEDLEG